MANTFGKRQPEAVPLIEMIAAAVPWHMDRMKVRRGVEFAAAAMIGFGIILWIAAHWSHIPRFTRFGLVGAALAASVAASYIARVRLPALIAAFLAAGGLLALVGQTYQTGADPWQLFAIWAALTLPWALTARHDALWFCWTAVVTTGLALWQSTFAGHWFAGNQPTPVMLVWTGLAGLALFFGPWDALQQWRGSTRWTFRLVVLLLLASLVHNGLADVFGGRSAGTIYFASLLLLAVIAVLIVNAEPFDFALLALAGLTADILLIGGAGRMLFQSRSDLIGGMFVMGLVSVAVVGATGSGLMAIGKDRVGGMFGTAGARVSAWPVALTSGIGALIASVPVIAFLSLFIGPFVLTGGGTFVIGFIALGMGCKMVRATAPTQFLQQVGVIALMLGLGLLAFAVFRDAKGFTTAPSLLMMLVATGLAFAVGRTWVTGLLGAIAAAFLSFAITAMFAVAPRGGLHLLPLVSAWSAIIAAGAAWFAWQSSWSQKTADEMTPLLVDCDRFIGGALAMALIATVATGPTFMLGNNILLGIRQNLVVGIPFGWQSLSVLSALLGAAGAAWFLLPRPSMQTVLGFATAAVVVALSAAIPALGALVLLFAITAPDGRKVLATAALATSLWVIGAFYYDLAWPLQNKAALMTACGLILIVVAFLAGERPHSEAVAEEPVTFWQPRAAFALITVGALATAGLAGQSIASMEAILAHGETAYLALAPVDPRSLMQGDYMALNFAVPTRDARRNPPRPGERLWATASLDPRRVATIDTVSAEKPATTPGKLIFELKAKSSRWIVGTDAWFFKEGTAKQWQQARFGEFRVGADGRALLVDLADNELKSLK